jgi:hypothetical protein
MYPEWSVVQGREGRKSTAVGESILTLGAGKDTEEVRRRVERGRDEVATGTETMERVAIAAVCSSDEKVCALLPESFCRG